MKQMKKRTAANLPERRETIKEAEDEEYDEEEESSEEEDY